MTDPQGRLRLTVLGNSTAVPHPESAAAGYLVEYGDTAIAVDCGVMFPDEQMPGIDVHDDAREGHLRKKSHGQRHG